MRKLLTVGALLSLATIVVLQGQGSGRPSTLRVRTDANNALVVSSATQTPPYTYTTFLNTTLKTDASGNLVVAGAGASGDISVDTITLPLSTTFTNQKGIIFKGSKPFMSNYTYGTGCGNTTDGHNTFLGEDAGNMTTFGACPTNQFYGSDVTAVGYNAFKSITGMNRGTAIGSFAFTSNLTGSYIVCVGYNCGYYNTTGSYNSYFGADAGIGNSSGSRNSCIGTNCLQLNESNDNSAIGQAALQNNVTGARNFAAGVDGGRYIADGSTSNNGANNGIYIGYSSKALAISQSFETVIGTVVGSGSYTFTTGNSKSALQLSLGDAPTCATNCGTSPTLTGNNSSFTLTMGATGSPASGFVVTFDTDGAFTAAPQCTGSMAKAGMVVGKLPLTLVTTTTTLTVVTNGTAPANSDMYHFQCTLGK